MEEYVPGWNAPPCLKVKGLQGYLTYKKTVYRSTSLARKQCAGEPYLQENSRQGYLTYKKMDHRGTSLTRKRTLLGPYRRPVPRVLGGF